MSSSARRGGHRLALAAAAVATVVTVTSCGQPASTGSPTAASESTGSAPTTAPQAGATQGAPGTSAQTEPAAPEADAVITTTAATQEVEGGERGVTRSRTVEVDATALPKTAAEAARKIELPLFDDTTVVADLDAPEFRSQAGYRAWNGTIAGDEGSTVVLVEQDGVLSGVVNSKHGTYRLRPLPDGSTQIEQIDQTQFAANEDAAVPAPAEADAPAAPAPAPADSGTPGTASDTSPVVDVLVSYTSA